MLQIEPRRSPSSTRKTTREPVFAIPIESQKSMSAQTGIKGRVDEVEPALEYRVIRVLDRPSFGSRKTRRPLPVSSRRFPTCTLESA